MADNNEDYKVVDLQKGQTKVTNPTQEVTQKEGETSVTRTYAPWMNADGTINEPMKQYDEQQRAALAGQYNVDPNTGNYKGDIGALIGVNPEEYKAKEEAKAKLERYKQKEAGWRNALGVLVDSATTAIGGNVWERKPDEVAAKAKAAAETADNNIAKMGQAVANAKEGVRQKWLAAEKARQENLIKNFGLKVTQKSPQITTKTTSKKVETTNGNYQQALKLGNGSGSGSGGGNRNFVVTTGRGTANEKHNEFQLSKQEYEDVANILKQRYTQVLNGAEGQEKANELRKLLDEAHAIKGMTQDGQYIFDDDVVMRGGSLWRLRDSDRDLITQKTGNKIVFKTKEDAQTRVSPAQAARNNASGSQQTTTEGKKLYS